MTITERNNKLKHFIICLKCEVSGKHCDDNCSIQYDAGNMGEIIENLEAISKALEQDQTTKNNLGVDCISRQAVIDLMIQKWGENFSGDSAMQESIDAIRVLPSVTLQAPNTGHWTDDGYCSCCNKQTLPLDISGYASGYDSFCPNCGAKMVEP